LDLIENPNRNLQKNSTLNAYSFFRLSEKVLNIRIIDSETKKELLARDTTTNDISKVSKFLYITPVTLKLKSTSTNRVIQQKVAISQDVYDTLMTRHFNKDKLDELKIINSAIS